MKFRSTVLASSLAVAALAFAMQASAACTYPKSPDKIPDGSKATKEEMIAGMKTMRAYNDLIKQYTDCLKTEHDQQVTKIDPSLATTIQTQFTALDTLVDKYRTTTNASGYVLYTALTAADKKLLSAAVKAVQEPLSQVSAKVASA